MKELSRPMRNAINRSVSSICSGNFDSDNVTALFSNLRPLYLGRGNASSIEETIFLDTANLICHSDERDRGYIHEGLKNLFNVAILMDIMLNSDININLLNKVPKSFIEVVKYRIRNPYVIDFLKNHNLNSHEINRFIQNYHPYNEEKKFFYLDTRISSQINTNKKFQNIFNLIKIIADPHFNQFQPILAQDQIIKSLIKILNQNNIKFNFSDLMKESEKIMLHILIRLHRLVFKLDEVTNITCYIDGVHRRISSDGLFVKNLSLATTIDSNGYIKNTTVPFRLYVGNIITTSLVSVKWCDESLFDDISMHSRDLEINDSFQLVEIKPHLGEKILNISFLHS